MNCRNQRGIAVEVKRGGFFLFKQKTSPGEMRDVALRNCNLED